MYKDLASRIIHSSYDPEEHHRAIMPPIYQNSVFKLKEVDEQAPYCYSRLANPTRCVLEKTMADIEGGSGAVALASGIAAIDVIWRLVLKPGGTIIAVNDIYGGAYDLLKQVYEPWGVNVIFTDLNNTEHLSLLLEDKSVQLIWLESPSNPLLKLIDIKQIVSIAKSKNIPVGADNTFATPYLQQPFALGVNFIAHSATKYLSGHSDVVLGIALAADKEDADKLRQLTCITGAIAGPMDCALVLRGLKTLVMRMQRHEYNAGIIAVRLTEHPEVKEVFYPGLSNHPHHTLAKKQMSGFGGVVSIRLKDDSRKKANRVIKSLRLFQLTPSLGGVECLVNHSYSQSHSGMSAEKKASLGISEGFLRFSIGLEDVEDIWNDLDQALRH